MASYDSWEDADAAQNNELVQQVKDTSLDNNTPYHRGPPPGSTSFNPGVASFQPAAAYRPPNYASPQTNQFYGHAVNDPRAYAQRSNAQTYSNQPYRQQSHGTGDWHGGQPSNNAIYGQANQPSYQTVRPQHPLQTNPAISRGPLSDPTSAVNDNYGAETPSMKASNTDRAPPSQKAKVLSIGLTKPNPPKTEEHGKAITAPASKSQREQKTEDVGDDKKASVPSTRRSSPSRGDKENSTRTADAVVREQAADVDEATLKELYGKGHLNVAFIGHVDAGKSTLGGAILVSVGMVDQRTLDKYKKDAKDMGRETWYLSWALDLTSQEREKGKTVEVGRGFFETDVRRYSILDTPGHKNYVPNMIGGASQADVAILVISSRKGEYETGFVRGGQTREHAMLVRTQGVPKLIVVINKMDDPTVQWSKERYDECTKSLSQFLKGIGYNLKNDVYFMPIAAQQMQNIKDRVPKDVCPWWDGPSLLEHLDSMQALDRNLSAPFMMPVSGKYRDLGTMVEGKIESGVVKNSMSLVMMPNKQSVDVTAVYTETEEETGLAQCGDQARIRLRGVEDEDIASGFVLCSPKRLVPCVTTFDAQIRIIELKSILTAGFNCIIHVHTAIEEVTVAVLLHSLQKGTNRRSKRPPSHAKKGDSIIARFKVTSNPRGICIEKYETQPSMGRFTLRDQGQTIAVGKITKLFDDEGVELANDT